MKDTIPCPCGNATEFNECCAPILQAKKKALTAEQLMRSRYTAYTLADNAYLLRSWAIKTRPKELHTDNKHIQWLKLDIEKCEKGYMNDTIGMVTFTALFLSSDKLYTLHEDSSFIKENNTWYYLEGKSDSHVIKIARNDPCPCGSGKKFKRCCCQ